MHWLPRSVGRKRAGKFKHAGIFSHDPVDVMIWHKILPMNFITFLPVDGFFCEAELVDIFKIMVSTE